MSEAVAAKLDEARALIEKGWCQGRWALNAIGEPVGMTHDAAVCFCAEGATAHVDPDRLGVDLDRFVRRAVGITCISDWNDAPERTRAEVIEAFRKAAELARGEQSVMGRAG